MSIVTQAFIVEKYGVRLDTEQLAELLSISPAALRNQITLGTCGIKTYRDGKKRWADYRDVAAYLDELRLHAA